MVHVSSCFVLMVAAHKQGAFDLEGKFPPVPANVKLWKGLFSDSLPGFIKEMDAKDPKVGVGEPVVG